jgi:hypothetical protein
MHEARDTLASQSSRQQPYGDEEGEDERKGLALFLIAATPQQQSSAKVPHGVTVKGTGFGLPGTIVDGVPWSTENGCEPAVHLKLFAAMNPVHVVPGQGFEHWARAFI